MTPISQAVRIVLARPSHPGNIGASARAMKTMGLGDLALVAPQQFPHGEAEAMAAGAADVLAHARVHATLAEALADCVLAVGLTARRRDLSLPFFPIREAAASIVETASSGRVALVFGNETSGLSNEELGHCRWAATIPAAGAYSSLNLGAAVQVASYEIAMAAGAISSEAPAARDLATAGDLEGLFAHFEDVALQSGYLDPRQPGRLMQRVRRLFARTALEREEVRFLRGLLSAAQSRMKGK